MSRQGDLHAPRKRLSVTTMRASVAHHSEASPSSLDLSEDLGEDIGLLNGPADAKDAAPWHAKHERASRRTAKIVRVTSGLVSLALLIAFVFAFLPGRRAGHASADIAPEDVGQLAIPLHPRLHASRKPETLTYRWNVTKGLASPDGVEKQVYLVNGLFPGPTIEARSGDRIVVHVHNGLYGEELALHWHGLQMKGQNAMDGAIGFTQCPIDSGRDFIYDFTIGDDEHGTFWWHSHSQVQRGDGLHGGLVIHKPNPSPPKDDEALLLVSDWFHRQQKDVLEWYADTWSLGNEPVPDSILINGRGRYNCSMAASSRPLICNNRMLGSMLPLLKKQTGRTRLRMVNTGTIAGVTMMIDGATLQVVELDGGCSVEAQPKGSLGILYPGERVDALLQWASAETAEPWVNIYLDPENFKLPNHALNPNHVFPALPKTLGSTDKQVARPLESSPSHMDLSSITSSTVKSNFDQGEDVETILLYIKTQKLSRFQNKPMGFINHTSWQPQLPPLLSQARASWDENQFIPFVSTGSKAKRINLVLNNLDDGSHPFHLHGNPFYVLSSFRVHERNGFGSYNPFIPGAKPPGWVNIETPVRKDTISIPRRGHVVLTIKADNPGLWMLHCHMLVHLGTGMAVGLHVGEANDYEHTSGLDVSAAQLCGSS